MRGLLLLWCLLSVSARAELPAGARPGARYIPNQRAKRDPQRATPYNFFNVKVGVGGSFNVLQAKVPYSETASSGIGYGVNLRVQLQVNLRWQFILSPQYQVLRMGRRLTDTVAVAEPVIEVSQKIQYFGGEALVAWLAQEPRIVGMWQASPDWWIEGGVQYLKPVAATQTNITAAGETTSSFGSPDRLLFMLLGVAGEMGFQEGYSITGYLHGFYNLGARGGSGIYGGRLGVAVNLTL